MTESSQALTEQQAMALRQVAGIGAGRAASSLRIMTGGDFTLAGPGGAEVSLTTFADIIGNPEELTAAVYMPVPGQLPGHAAFLFPYDCACALADQLLEQPKGTTRELGELEMSALVEVGNVIVSSFLNAISDLTGLTLPATPPGIAVDMRGAILGSIMGASGMGDPLTIVSRVAELNSPVEGIFVFIPEPEALVVFLSALGAAG